MPKVPQYTSQASAPTGRGPSGVSLPRAKFAKANIPRAPQNLGQQQFRAAEGLAKELRVHAQQMWEEDQRRRMVEKETAFQNEAREIMREAQSMQGGAALPDPDKDKPGVYGFVQDRMDKLKRKYTGFFDGKYETAFQKKLNSHVTTSLNKAAQKQAKERRAHTELVAQNAATAHNEEIVEAGGDPSVVGRVMRNVEDDVLTLFPNQPEKQKQYLATTKATLAESAVVSALDNPDMAQQQLENFKGFLSADSYKTLEGQIERKRTAQRVQAHMQSLIGLPYEDQLRQVEQIEDPAERQAVLSQVDQAERIRANIEAEQQMAVYEDLWTQIVKPRQEGKTPSVAVTDVLEETRLSTGQREHLVNMLASGGQDSKQDYKDLIWAENMRTSMLGNVDGYSRQDIVRQGIEDGASPGAVRRAVNAWEELQQMPSLGSGLQQIKRTYPDVFESDETESQFMDSMFSWASSHKQQKGYAPTHDEVMEHGEKLIKRENESRWYSFLPLVGGSKPLYRQIAEDGQATYTEDGVQKTMLPNGETRWQQGGYIYVQFPDGRKLRRPVPNADQE